VIRAAALGLLLALLAAAPAQAKRVRVFAVGPKFDLSWVDTREHYRAHLLALMDARERGRVPASIQRGADDVASDQLGPADPERPVATARDLVTLPEDIGCSPRCPGRAARRPARSRRRRAA
jgi:hypothetical protein